MGPYVEPQKAWWVCMVNTDTCCYRGLGNSWMACTLGRTEPSFIKLKGLQMPRTACSSQQVTWRFQGQGRHQQCHCLIVMEVGATIPRALLRSQTSETQSPQGKDSFPQIPRAWHNWQTSLSSKRALGREDGTTVVTPQTVGTHSDPHPRQ